MYWLLVKHHILGDIYVNEKIKIPCIPLYTLILESYKTKSPFNALSDFNRPIINRISQRVCVNVYYSAFTCHPTCFGSRLVWWCSFEELSHEGNAVPPDVRLPSEGVEDGIGTAADESKGRANCTGGKGDVVQSTGKKVNILLRLVTKLSWSSQELLEDIFLLSIFKFLFTFFWHMKD